MIPDLVNIIKTCKVPNKRNIQEALVTGGAPQIISKVAKIIENKRTKITKVVKIYYPVLLR